MNEIILILLKVLPIILILILGYWMKRIRYINIEIIRGMKKITLGISLPSLLFLTFFKAEMKVEFLLLSFIIFATCILLFVKGFLTKFSENSPSSIGGDESP